MEKDLIEGKLDRPRVRQIMSLPKDADRFEEYVVLPQERVPSPEKILLPLGEHPYVAGKGMQRIVKRDSGCVSGASTDCLEGRPSRWS